MQPKKKEVEGVSQAMNPTLTAIRTHNYDCAFVWVYSIVLIRMSMSTVIALVVDKNLMYVYRHH